jgi:hypothetical protein
MNIYDSTATVRHLSDQLHSTSTQTEVRVVIIVMETEIYRTALTLPFGVQNSIHLRGIQKNKHGRVVSYVTKERQFIYAFVELK